MGFSQRPEHPRKEKALRTLANLKLLAVSYLCRIAKCGASQRAMQVGIRQSGACQCAHSINVCPTALPIMQAQVQSQS